MIRCSALVPLRGPRLAAVCVYLCATLSLSLGGEARADAGLTETRVRELLLKGLPANSHHPKIELHNAEDRCTDPRPYLQHPEQRGFGKVMVGVRCAGQSVPAYYVQAQVAVMGSYVVSPRRIAPGQAIEADMLMMRSGPLDKLPANAALNPKDLIGLRATRAFSPSSPLLSTAFRKAWLVEQNHQVTVQVQGLGFMLSRAGKALDNGYLGDEVRVASGRGKVLQAKVTGPDRLLVRD
ncbi:MAG: flagellar basal body P-ring formation chaperone FlgA [Pseudomonas sp.]|nr:flagellar basal body P-ring formation chaperone FlgA [Pseudomonas sp.]